jgi:PAS domain S-box-containing protein
VLFLLRRALSSTFDGILTFMRRLPPEGVVANMPLLEYLLGRDAGADGGARTVAEAAFKTSQDGIVFTNHRLEVDFVNPSVRRIFGVNPEELLGQSLATMFVQESATKLKSQAELMVRGEAGRNWTEVLTASTGSGGEVYCTVTLLGLGERGVEHLAAILRDNSQLVLRQREASEAKERSEQLLYQILPRSIVQRLSAGETEISFVVASATLMFVDIEKFSDYTAGLAPDAILKNLSFIFNGYDACCAKYDLLLKMKIVGDVYMVAGGLFAPESNPAEHASQMVRLGLDCIRVIEDSNNALDACLAVRIGVNTGGPITAGVLGTDKPLFDILGDTINVAARLQSMDVPGKVEISEATNSFVQGNAEFDIEPRGLVFLKGKGMRPAFLVTRRSLVGSVPRGGGQVRLEARPRVSADGEALPAATGMRLMRNRSTLLSASLLPQVEPA